MKKLLFAVLALLMFESCAPRVITRTPVPVPERGEKRGSWSLHSLGIPPGHMPPPGHCRIWYPGRPPGHQSPPFKCATGRLSIPLGSFLVQRLDGPWVQVDEYDRQRPDFIVQSGRFQFDDKKEHKQGHKKGHHKTEKQGKHSKQKHKKQD